MCRTAPAILILVGLALFGCAETDPLTRPGSWQPGGANEANLAASVENSGDLVRGRQGDGGMDALLAQQAIARLRAGAIKPLGGGLADIKVIAPEAPGAAPAIAAPPGAL